MKQTIVGLLALLLGISVYAAAGDFENNRAGGFGAGPTVGQPMGVSAKFWLSNITAVDGMLGYHLDDNFDIHTDFLVHGNIFQLPNKNDCLAYIGLGGRVLAGDDTQFGLRFPIGVSHLFIPKSIEVFAEIAPVVRLNGIHYSMDGVAGIRLYNF